MISLATAVGEHLARYPELGSVDLRISHRLDFIEITFARAKGKAIEFARCLLDPAAMLSTVNGAALDFVSLQLTGTLDSFCAVVMTDIPQGAEWLALGNQRAWPDRDLRPVTMLDRRRRLYQRQGDPAPRPWPAIVFYNDGRRGVVEVGAAAP